MNLNTLSTQTTGRRRYTDDCIIIYIDIFIKEANLAQLSQLDCPTESFTDSNKCTDFIAHLTDRKIFCLISSQLVEQNIHFLNYSPLVTSIYVICTNKRKHHLWTKYYSKVKGESDDILSITEALKRDVQLVYRNSTPVTTLESGLSSQPTNTLNAMFMYYELLKETFLEMNHGKEAKREFVNHCKREYADNEAALRTINEFDRDYDKHSPTWWYTRDCFVYHMLNKALRTHNIKIINKFGFFIKDLHRQLEDLRRTLPNRNFTVYRGQSMSNEEFLKLKQSVGGLISFNSFLSTSADQHVSRLFALSSLDNPDIKAIFYVIDVDLALTSSPIGYLDESFSYFYGEQEYLWGMNAVFRISAIQELDNGLCQVNLMVTSDDDVQLKQLTDYMRRDVGILPGMQQLGSLMIEMGEWSKAKDIYETLLQEDENYYTIQQLGYIAHRMKDLDAALRYYRRALSVFATLASPNDSELATIYSNVGCVLNDKGRLREALKQYQRTLELECNAKKPNIVNIARTYNNIGTIRDKQGRRKEALEIGGVLINAHQNPPRLSPVDKTLQASNSSRLKLEQQEYVCTNPYSSATNYHIGGFPISMTSGNFNNDSTLDLLVVNRVDNVLSLLLGNADGSFTSQFKYSTGKLPESVTIGDFNNDGKLDLAETNLNDNTVSVLLGNGDGSFQSHIPHKTGNGPESVTSGDFNNDNMLDLAVANSFDNTISVLLGNGDGNFQSQITYKTENWPHFVISGDFNQDSNLDLAVTNWHSNTVSILLGNGDGDFRSQITHPTGKRPSTLTSDYFNKDNMLDLAVANSFDNTISVLLGNGDGNFQSQITYQTGAWPYSVISSDFNNDSKPDLAVTNHGGNTVSVLLGNGDGSFQFQIAYQTRNDSSFVISDDFNEDNNPIWR
ncbi:unnamed protein product [Rotaria magnacalcarata]